ncbi:hypothetical protein VTK73DRAFT_8516 [Phialemonium thermophilum]|uniref:Uncharacterized protein n=1 Tax=Phialemonium thermophilum TaxID=223376 RepID=A0ABR3W8T9_9PEZI
MGRGTSRDGKRDVSGRIKRAKTWLGDAQSWYGRFPYSERAPRLFCLPCSIGSCHGHHDIISAAGESASPRIGQEKGASFFPIIDEAPRQRQRIMGAPPDCTWTAK